MKATLSFRADNSKDRSFFAARFFAVRQSCTKLAQFLTDGFRSGVLTYLSRDIGVSITKVFFGSKALQVFCPVVHFVSVNVMYVLVGVKISQPARRYNTVHQPFPAQHEVSLGVYVRRVRAQISKNFPATRDSVKMVKHSVFNTSHCEANHVAPFLVIARTSSYH